MAGDIVICELLCFGVNRIDNTSNNVIIKLCTDFYSPKEIEHAKELLHNACSQSRSDLERLRPRKGPKKAQSDMTDILQLVHEMGTDVPCFVAVNLAKLSVLGMENINLAAMVADIFSLKKQMAELKCFVQRVDTVESLHPDFYADGVSAFQDDEQLIGRPHGGIGILWRKTLGAHVNCLKYDGERRLMALSVKHGSHSLLLLNVYLPYFTGSDNDDNFHEFMAVIGKAIGIIGTSPTLNACIIGDFNACTTKNTLFGKEIRLMCDDNGLLLSDVTLLPPDSFTFYSDVHQSTSWLDHCVSTLQAHLSITDINIAYDVLSSDHFPLAMSFELPTKRATKSDIEAYHRRCSPLLSSIAIPHVALLCSDAQCDNISHREALSKLYRDITNAMLTSSAASIPTKRQQRHKPVPGWNEFVKEHHAAARLSFTLWVSAGKPRQGSLHEQMSRDRARFKFALRRCKRDEAQIKAGKLAESFLPLDNTAFWKEVQAQSLRSTPLVASVNGTSGEDAIANMWAKHYGEILNASDTDTSRKRLIKELHAAYESAVSEGSLNNSLFSPREETWLSPSEIVILKALHPDLYADGVSAFQDDEQLIGRPHGGIGILWRKTLGAHVNCLKYDGERRLMALSVKHGSHSLLLLNVYLPYFTGSDNYHEFMAVIGKAIGIIGTSPTLNACIIGDFNAYHFPLAMSFGLPTKANFKLKQ
ncbi:hypothetical protein CAPTEDRAFT_218181 [Capitella teleta]|uniref:Endonuclease/exonuclease/phosphatase domain-containing protein n=1 Tax=Capitella teleta TaxID=283909 RepID=R7URD0_CAPTE|nr:hypothetical protein CAPTEDRAFT_218181 [Capitella teleta]|eukprot:ELU09064.1 hypothetical protein CAPTEDRAFT_218181 [Capitella teleta]